METRKLNVRIPKEQYAELEEIVQSMDKYVTPIEEKAMRDKDKHVSLSDYGKSRVLK